MKNRNIGLTNPSFNPPLDRVQPQDCDVRQRNLGFYNKPRNFNDLSIGDAGAGESRFRRAQFFQQLARTPVIEPAPIPGWNFSDINYDESRAMFTTRSADTRPRFFLVSFFNYGVVREVDGPTFPLPERTIMTAAGQAPSTAMVKGRVQIHDESGSRFFDVNVIGTRSFTLYAFGVTVFALLPSVIIDGERIVIGSEINAQNPSTTPIGVSGLVEDSIFSARIIPAFQNATQIVDNITLSVNVPSGGEAFVEIPPGASQLNILQVNGPLPVNYTIQFSANNTLAPSPIQAGAGLINISDPFIRVPNAKFVVFGNTGPVFGSGSFTLQFTVEA